MFSLDLNAELNINFELDYPQLYILFGACFFVGVEEGLEDEDVLKQYLLDCTVDYLLDTKVEMTDFVQHPEYWKDAAYAAWRYFPNDAELAAWINRIGSFFKELTI